MFRESVDQRTEELPRLQHVGTESVVEVVVFLGFFSDSWHDLVHIRVRYVFRQALAEQSIIPVANFLAGWIDADEFRPSAFGFFLGVKEETEHLEPVRGFEDAIAIVVDGVDRLPNRVGADDGEESLG